MKRTFQSRLLWLSPWLGLSMAYGCAEEPGQHAGDFGVVQTLEENSCGAGALPAPDPLVFQAELRRGGHRVYWRYETRETYVSGSEIDGTMSFSMLTSMEQPVPQSDGSMVVCRLVQQEVLRLQTSESSDDLLGSNQIVLSPANAECAALTQDKGGPFLALPCQVSYSVSAVRLDAQSDASQSDASQSDAGSGADGGANTDARSQ